MIEEIMKFFFEFLDIQVNNKIFCFDNPRIEDIYLDYKPGYLDYTYKII